MAGWRDTIKEIPAGSWRTTIKDEAAEDGASDQERQFLDDYKAAENDAENGEGILDRAGAKLKAWQMGHLMERSGPEGIPYASPELAPMMQRGVGDDLGAATLALPAGSAASLARGASQVGSAIAGPAKDMAAISGRVAKAIASRSPSLKSAMSTLAKWEAAKAILHAGRSK